MKSKLFLVLFFFQLFLIFSQEQCLFTKKQNEFFKQNPEAKKVHDELEFNLLQKSLQEFIKQKKSTSNTVYEIPVVVHLMNDGNTPLKTDAEIISWIDNCNKYFATTFGSEWLTESNGGTVFPFKLVLAKRSPNCTATNGINQINVTNIYSQYSERGLNGENSDGVDEAELKALSRWDPQLYYNIYIVNTFDSTPIDQSGGLQGYAYFPSTPDSFYGTFIKASVVTGNDPTTLPHEIGHSLGLLHTFEGGTTGSCPPVTTGCEEDNDKVCDTPATKSLLGISKLPTNEDTNECDPAGWNNVQFNIMNYTSVNKLFTPGQRDRALAMFLVTRENLTKSLGGTAIDGSTSESTKATTCTPRNFSLNGGNFAFGMTLVEIGDIKNRSDANLLSNGNKAYYDYTVNNCLTNAFSTDLVVANNPQSIKLKNGGPNDGIYSAWIDYNNDGSFSTDELVVSDQSILKNSESTFQFNIPTTRVVFNTSLRLRVIGDSEASSTSPCAQRKYGEVEDYTITLKAGDPLIKDELKSKVSISPNPTSNIIKINYDKVISKVTIVNLAGQTVFNKNFNEKHVDLNLSDLAPAIYFVNVTTEDSIVTKKIIKK